MMNALRMVWIISRHYNRDERMVPLMERIAFELAERVARVINVRTLFKWVHLVVVFIDFVVVAVVVKVAIGVVLSRS